MTPERSINHHFTYHIAQASQAKHGSLVDRGANGGLAGITYRCAIHTGQTIFIKITKICKPECAEKDSHCHDQ